jgi:hypothetical protein
MLCRCTQGREKEATKVISKQAQKGKQRKKAVNIYGNFLFHSKAVALQEMHSQPENIVRSAGLKAKKAKQSKQQAGKCKRR